MDLVYLSLFKFKYLEGVLEYWKPIDSLTSEYSCNGRKVRVTFDIKDNTASIIENNQCIETLNISKLLNKLKEMGLVKERFDNRHSSSYIPLNSKGV